MADRIRFSEKLAYALGDAAAGGIVWKVMSIAFPLFFTNIFGLSFADAAMLMLVARLFDVVTDPIMGSLADRTQSRWGTYRPSLYSLLYSLLYSPLSGFPHEISHRFTHFLLLLHHFLY